MNKSLFALIALLSSCFVSDAYSHGGGLNSAGCHNNRKTGGYHCHRGGYTLPRITAPQRTYTPPRLYNPTPRLAAPPAPVRPPQPLLGSFSNSERNELLQKISALEKQVAQLKADNKQLSARSNSQNSASSDQCQIKINSLKKYYEGRLKGQQNSQRPRQVQQRNNQVIRLGDLHYEERHLIKSACYHQKEAPNYNRCILAQVNTLKNAPRLNDLGLDQLHYEERHLIKSACYGIKAVAAYNRCIQNKINQLQNAPRLID